MIDLGFCIFRQFIFIGGGGSILYWLSLSILQEARFYHVYI